MESKSCACNAEMTFEKKETSWQRLNISINDQCAMQLS